MAAPRVNPLVLAVRLFHMGQLEQAALHCSNLVRLQPKNPDPLYLLGLIRDRQGRSGEAIDYFKRFVTLKRTIGVKRRTFEDHRNLGIALFSLKQYDEAIESFRGALKFKPHDGDLHRSLGITMAALRRFDAAADSFDKALAVGPDAKVYILRGDALRNLRRYDAAIASFREALKIDARDADAHNGLGVALMEIGSSETAVTSFQDALAIRPNDANTLFNLGAALKRVGRHDAAIASLRKGVAIDPRHVQAQNSLGNSLKQAKQYDAALACFEKVLAVNHHHANALSMSALLKRQICDWRGMPTLEARLIRGVQSGRLPVAPFILLSVTDDPAVQNLCARQYWNTKDIATTLPGPSRAVGHPKLRIGYFSAELRTHPIPCLVAQLFEEHDRSRFEVFAFSYGDNDGTPMRERLEKAFDRFFDVRQQSDGDIAHLIRQQEIDILIDLTGHTADSRLEILASRPAPVQLHYLGFPGTLGVDFIDYLIVDPFVVPQGDQKHYTESLIYLSRCYQANDRKRRGANFHPDRAEVGLPSDAFVFCSFNQTYKITPQFFDIWMRLLATVPNSVLWLLADNKWAETNLRQEASARGVSADRLIFAPRQKLPEHLARHRLADLFLDTFPYNAHTTASDALWMGLPVVTCTGRSFASRVAGSLLRAVGLPELITHDSAGYEQLALALAHEPARLGGMRRHLEGVRASTPLFDIDRTRREIETAYQQTWEIWRRGEPPRSMVIGPA
jgi:predicted O-linked N-acetylglucosamine transferase (SPINDLY family)